MEKIRLNYFSSSFKWMITAFLLLVSLAFAVAILQSYLRYHLNHQKTVEYYLGSPEEGELILPKPLSHLVSTTHIHSFSMPLVFLAVWLGLQGVPLREGIKKIMIVGGLFSILIYNAAPYLVRYRESHWVYLFSIGGSGLFLFFFWPCGAILYETWFGFKTREEK